MVKLDPPLLRRSRGQCLSIDPLYLWCQSSPVLSSAEVGYFLFGDRIGTLSKLTISRFLSQPLPPLITSQYSSAFPRINSPKVDGPQQAFSLLNSGLHSQQMTDNFVRHRSHVYGEAITLHIPVCRRYVTLPVWYMRIETYRKSRSGCWCLRSKSLCHRAQLIRN
jgi:hypothetical protein